MPNPHGIGPGCSECEAEGTRLWSEEQVKALNSWQSNGQFHPFTCPGEYNECEGRRELVATVNGWVCQCGRYTQGWAHGFMFGGAHA